MTRSAIASVGAWNVVVPAEARHPARACIRESSPMAKAVSLADELYGRLKAEITSGVIAPGSKLPSQKDIADSENVSRTVVREAVARLEAQGYAVSRQGSGVYVSETARYRAFQVTREELSELS